MVSSSRWPRFTTRRQLGLGQTGAVVIDHHGEPRRAFFPLRLHGDLRPCPFAGIVEQVPDHLLEILLLALELEIVAARHLDIETALFVDAVERPLQRAKGTASTSVMSPITLDRAATRARSR